MKSKRLIAALFVLVVLSAIGGSLFLTGCTGEKGITETIEEIRSSGTVIDISPSGDFATVQKANGDIRGYGVGVSGLKVGDNVTVNFQGSELDFIIEIVDD